MVEPDYSQMQMEQFKRASEAHGEKLKRLIRGRIDTLRERKPIPRYLLRALESGEDYRVEACIKKAIKEGWTPDDLGTAIEQHRFTDT